MGSTMMEEQAAGEKQRPSVRMMGRVWGRLENRHFLLICGVLAGGMLILLILPLVALLWRTAASVGEWGALAGLAAALLLSLWTTAVSVGCMVLLGTPLAYLFAYYDFWGKRLLSVFIELPIVMPPIVAGLALLSAFGRRGLLGSFLAEWGVQITFSWPAVILAQTFVAAPFFIRAAQSAFREMPRDLQEAASMDGADEWQTFRYVLLPLTASGLAAGLVLSWARALGEFGATILFAGNLQGSTQTMPLFIYAVLEQNVNLTFVAAVILLGLAAVSLFLARWLAGLDEVGEK